MYLAIYTSKTRKGKKGRKKHSKRFEKERKKMKKHVALVLVWVVVGVCVEAMTLEERRDDCNNYCNRACMFPSKFCKWWCGARCQNPILWGK